MTASEEPAKSAGGNDYAEERIGWLKGYLKLAEAFAAEVRLTTYEEAYSAKAKHLQQKLELDRRQAQRVLAEVDFDGEFSRERNYRNVHLVLRKGIHEWERFRDEIDVRIARLIAFLALAREVAVLEKCDVDDQALKNSTPDPVVRARSDAAIAERAPSIRAGRDSLAIDQPEIEVLLRVVENSFGSWSFAAGVWTGVDFVAGQILQAVGKYRRLVRPPRRGWSQAPSNAPPAVSSPVQSEPSIAPETRAPLELEKMKIGDWLRELTPAQLTGIVATFVAVLVAVSTVSFWLGGHVAGAQSTIAPVSATTVKANSIAPVLIQAPSAAGPTPQATGSTSSSSP